MNDTSSKRKQSPEEIIAEKIADLIAADATIKKLKAELEEAQAERQIAVDALMPFFEESGVSSISMKGLGKLAYLYRQIWAGTADEVENQAVVDVLKKSGMAHMVTYNHMSLSGWVREQAKLAVRDFVQALLDEPSRGLDEVARGAGFRSTAQLVRAYRTVTGKAPREP